MKNYDMMKDIVDGIVGDITMRSGLGDVWDGIDEGTKKDIEKEWVRIIYKELKFRQGLKEGIKNENKI